MTPPTRTGTDGQTADRPASSRGGPVLAVIAAAQLMVVLASGTTHNIAVPEFLADPDMPDAAPSWLVILRVLTFGALLLLGGRLGDVFGRRRVFRAGLSLFLLGSTLAAVPLFPGQILQGAGAALVVPTALSLIMVNFPEGKPRNRAVGVYVAMTGVGLPLSIVLTYEMGPLLLVPVNIITGLIVLAGTKVLAEDEHDTGGLDIPDSLDVPSAVIGTGGLFTLLYGVMDDEYGWPDTISLVSIAAGLVLLAVFLVLQRRSARPLMPLHLFADRGRAGANAALLLIGPGVFAVFYLLMLSLHADVYNNARLLDRVLVYLPFGFGIAIAAVIGSRLADRLPPRLIAGPGLLIAAAGMLWFAVREPGSPYLTHIMPALITTAAGLGFGFVPVLLTAVSRVPDRDAGIASALANTAQHVGGVLGFAVLTTLFTTVRDDLLSEAEAEHERAPDSSEGIHIDEIYAGGYTTVFLAASVLFTVAFIVVLTVLRTPRPPEQTAGETAAAPLEG